MQQLLLDISTQEVPSLKTFVPGRNEELLQVLQQITQRESPERFVYLWGDSAVGKSHLLAALSQFPPARYLTAGSRAEDFEYRPEISLYLLDDCDRLSADMQVAAFSLFNAVRAHGAFMVAAGTKQPSQLAVRDDLKSRMAWGLPYRVYGLSDDEKIGALGEIARERGFTLAKDVLPYLITHYPRDMRTLSAILDALDRYSLQTKRSITLPLLREMMQKTEE